MSSSLTEMTINVDGEDDEFTIITVTAGNMKWNTCQDPRWCPDGSSSALLNAATLLRTQFEASGSCDFRALVVGKGDGRGDVNVCVEKEADGVTKVTAKLVSRDFGTMMAVHHVTTESVVSALDSLINAIKEIYSTYPLTISKNDDTLGFRAGLITWEVTLPEDDVDVGIIATKIMQDVENRKEVEIDKYFTGSSKSPPVFIRFRNGGCFLVQKTDRGMVIEVPLFRPAVLTALDCLAA